MKKLCGHYRPRLSPERFHSEAKIYNDYLSSGKFQQKNEQIIFEIII